MIERAPAGGAVEFSVGSAEEFSAAGVDVLVSNAALQWVPTHRQLIVEWARELNPGGWLAFQVPANFDAPSHVLMRELAESERGESVWAACCAARSRPHRRRSIWIC